MTGSILGHSIALELKLALLQLEYASNESWSA